MAAEVPPESKDKPKSGFRVNKFVVGGAVIIVAVVMLAITSLNGNAQYYMTIDELKAAPDKWNQTLRISGAVRGETIQFDPASGNLSFEVVNVPGDMQSVDEMGGLAAMLHQAVSDPNAATLIIRYHGARPDLLKNEAQAIVTGKMQPDGTFLANDLLLKCPSKYQAAPTN